MPGALRYLACHLSLACAAVWRDRRGATAIEYALIGVGISVAIVAALFAVGDEIVGLFGDIQSDFADNRPS